MSITDELGEGYRTRLGTPGPQLPGAVRFTVRVIHMLRHLQIPSPPNHHRAMASSCLGWISAESFVRCVLRSLVWSSVDIAHGNSGRSLPEESGS